jgi:outer membrane protein assembly factor BamB
MNRERPALPPRRPRSMRQCVLWRSDYDGRRSVAASSTSLLSRAAGCALLAWLWACSAHPPLLRLASTPAHAGGESAWQGQVALVDAAIAGERDRAGGTSSLALAARGSSLVATELEAGGATRERWRVRAEIIGAPVLPSWPRSSAQPEALVLYGDRNEIVALSAAQGTRRWALPARGRTLLAASSSGGRTALLTSDRTGRRALSLCDADGRERLDVVADASLGTPALIGDVLLAPFGDGNVAAIDAAAGVERARSRLGARPLHALRTGDGLFFGGPPWLALDGAAPIVVPRRPLPGVVLGPSEPEPPQPPADVTRLYVPTSAAAQPASGGTYMATYGRIALGLEREHGSLLWVVALQGRALAGALVPEGLLVCDDSGALRLLAARSGNVAQRWQLLRRPRTSFGESALAGCALAPGNELAPESGSDASEPLLEQLARVLALSDPGMTDAQRFLSRELAARPEPEATRLLIELVTRHSLDRALQSEAEDLLAIRRNGQQYMLAALEDGQRGADATALPPIAPLGEALAALGERRAAPLLARQLNRPAHTAAALARAASALQQLASDAEYDELSVFFSLHRTTADSPELISAVITVGKTLLAIAGPRARGLLELATRDPLTVPDVRSALENALREPTTTAGAARLEP